MRRQEALWSHCHSPAQWVPDGYLGQNNPKPAKLFQAEAISSESAAVQRLLPPWEPDSKLCLTGTAAPTASVCWNILINAALSVKVQPKGDLLADLNTINPSLGEDSSRDGS